MLKKICNILWIFCAKAVEKILCRVKMKKERGGLNNMATVMDIAQWFLKQQPMTHKKLQKIVYYAYAWYYTLTGRKLFNGEFEAWIHGPVNRQLYTNYAGNGWNVIAYDPERGCNVTKEQSDFLETILQVFGGYDADQLENMTHQERPWIEARAGIPANQPSCNIISDEMMREFYGNLGRQNQME